MVAVVSAMTTKTLKPLVLAGIGTLLLSGTAPHLVAQENKNCPIMTKDEVDPEESVEFEGVKVGLCCAKCGKLWAQNAKYYIKAAPEQLPQFKGMEEKLGLKEITLLPQKFCPIKTDNLICPDSPHLEHSGKKVYFFDQRAVEKWQKDPEGNAKRAKEAGLLPQLKDA